jgi:hypothetical protein
VFSISLTRLNKKLFQKKISLDKSMNNLKTQEFCFSVAKLLKNKEMINWYQCVLKKQIYIMQMIRILINTT